MKLAPSLHRIGSDLVNSHWSRTPVGVTVIDAGLPGHWTELETELAGIGRSLDDIRGVVLTHGDTDVIRRVLTPAEGDEPPARDARKRARETRT